MGKLEKADKLLQQFPRGIRASEFARALGIQRTAAYDLLNSLAARGKAESRDGLWYPKNPVVENKPPGETERERLIDALIGYHEPSYFRKLP